jgi:hypothetical protein
LLLELASDSIETGVDCSDEILESLLVPAWMRVDLVIFNLMGRKSFGSLVEEDGSCGGLTSFVSVVDTLKHCKLLTVPISTEMIYSLDIVV